MGKKFPYFFFKFQDGPDAGKDEQVLVHTRSIGDKNYTVTKINLEGSDPCNEETEEVVEENNLTGEEKDELIETEMDDCELENFKSEWEEKWNPTIQENEPGIFARFFTMLNPFN